MLLLFYPPLQPENVKQLGAECAKPNTSDQLKPLHTVTYLVSPQ